jgi:hypothetical protein
MAATDLYLIRKNQQWAKYSAVEALTVDVLAVMSSEFRDTFSSAATIAPSSSAGVNPSSISGPFAATSIDFDATVTDVKSATITSSASSDEVAHEDLRQTSLSRTFWKFDIGAAATPRYLYAWVLEGDIIANNPPETV